MENCQLPVDENSGKNDQDYSAFLDLVEKGKKSKEDINDRINQRLKFLEIEGAQLEILKEDPVSNAHKIEKQQELVNNINDEILELSKKISGMDEKAKLYLKGDEGAKEMLEKFKPEIEH